MPGVSEGPCRFCCLSGHDGQGIRRGTRARPGFWRLANLSRSATSQRSQGQRAVHKECHTADQAVRKIVEKLKERFLDFDDSRYWPYPATTPSSFTKPSAGHVPSSIAPRALVKEAGIVKDYTIYPYLTFTITLGA